MLSTFVRSPIAPMVAWTPILMLVLWTRPAQLSLACTLRASLPAPLLLVRVSTTTAVWLRRSSSAVWRVRTPQLRKHGRRLLLLAPSRRSRTSTSWLAAATAMETSAPLVSRTITTFRKSMASWLVRLPEALDCLPSLSGPSLRVHFLPWGFVVRLRAGALPSLRASFRFECLTFGTLRFLKEFLIGLSGCHLRNEGRLESRLIVADDGIYL